MVLAPARITSSSLYISLGCANKGPNRRLLVSVQERVRHSLILNSETQGAKLWAGRFSKGRRPQYDLQHSYLAQTTEICAHKGSEQAHVSPIGTQIPI